MLEQVTQTPSSTNEQECHFEDNIPFADNDRIELVNPSTIDATTFGNTRIEKEHPNKALFDSIKENGVTQSVTARELDDGSLQLIAGFTRHRIATMLKLETIPCLIKKVSDSRAMEIHLAENLCRSDLSLAEEARSASRLMALCEGDTNDASSRLGWSEKKLNDRLALNRCTDNVLIALDALKIKLGHAIILSSFKETVQNNTLVKILEENWTVEQLNAKAVAKNRPLSKAKFDVTECQSCPHNTVSQMDMFEQSLNSEAHCAFVKCFKEKTQHWLNEQKEIASEKFGKVLFWFQATEADRNTVSALAVGDKQLLTCQTCTSNVAIMDDREGSEGNIVSNQCVDKLCFSKCSKAHKKAMSKATEVATTTDANVPVGGNSAEPKQATSKPSETAPKADTVFDLGKASSATDKLEQTALAKATFADINAHESLPLAYLIAQMLDRQGITSDLKGRDIGETIASLLTLSKVELDEMAQKVVINELAQNKGAKGEITTPINILLSTAKKLPNGKEIAVKGWQPTVDVLNSYTIAGISALCKGSGFVKAFSRDEENVEKNITFSSIQKNGKAKFIKAILAYTFDWSGYAPQSMLARV